MARDRKRTWHPIGADTEVLTLGEAEPPKFNARSRRRIKALTYAAWLIKKRRNLIAKLKKLDETKSNQLKQQLRAAGVSGVRTKNRPTSAEAVITDQHSYSTNNTERLFALAAAIDAPEIIAGLTLPLDELLEQPDVVRALYVFLVTECGQELASKMRLKIDGDALEAAVASGKVDKRIWKYIDKETGSTQLRIAYTK